MKRLLLVLALGGALAALAFDAPLLGVIEAPTNGARNQNDTNRGAFTISPGQCITVDCANDAGTATNALMKWTTTLADAGSVTRQNWSRNTAYWETCAGQTYYILSVMGSTEQVFCHITATGTP